MLIRGLIVINFSTRVETNAHTQHVMHHVDHDAKAIHLLIFVYRLFVYYSHRVIYMIKPWLNIRQPVNKRSKIVTISPRLSAADLLH